MIEPYPNHPGVLISIDDVHIEASPADREAMHWFYGTLAELRMPTGEQQESADAVDGAKAEDSPATLRFRSEQHDLLVSLVNDPKIDSNPCRVIIAVTSLDRIGATLDERKTPYERSHGLYHTEEYISVLDPAGNRVRFQRAWPATF